MWQDTCPILTKAVSMETRMEDEEKRNEMFTSSWGYGMLRVSSLWHELLLTTFFRCST